MYGIFNIPCSVESSEKKEYRNYMCTLCDSLHEDYGVKGRLLTNYDSTTLALLIGSLDKSLKKEISASPGVLCLRPLKHKKSPDKFKFVSAVSIMIAYSRSLDETIETGKKMPHWISRSSEKASNYLSRYGLDKSFFENKLQEQHRLEKECNTIETLSAASSEILSRIFGAIGELTDQTGYSSNLKKLGFELGKLIYVYDGLLDFQKDSKSGVFNCLSACYLDHDKDIQRVSIEIFDFIENTRNNISSILKIIEFENNDNLIKRIFMQDFKVSEINHKQNILYIFKGIKSTCGTGITLSKQTIYDIMTGKLLVKFVQDERGDACDLCCGVSCLGVCVCPVIGCCYSIWLKKRPKKDVHPELTKFVDVFKKEDAEEWNQLGSTREEREKNINKLFDAHEAILKFAIRHNFYEKAYKKKKFVEYGEQMFVAFMISRSLAAMEQREREFLRITYLLKNEGKLNEGQWNYYRFAFIYGDGKASIGPSAWTGVPEISEGQITASEWYMKHGSATVDSAINSLMKIIEESSKVENANKTFKEIKGRLSGSGSWLTYGDINDTVFNGKGNYQLNLGLLESSDTLLHYSGEGSLITIAPPGSGKTQCFVLPNMLNWKGAALVLDIKGEIYAATHKWRSKNVGQVFKFSPLDPKNSNNYNPLTFIRQDEDYIWEDSRFLADMMIVPSGASDPFWENMARDVLTAAIAYVSFNNEPGDRPMSKVLDLIYGIGWDEMIIGLKTNVFVSAMRQTGHALGEMEKKQRDSVLKTAQSSLSAWQGERIAKVTKKSDWNPLDLRKGNPTIYICLNPNEIDSYLSVLRVFIAQHIRMLTTELPPRDVAPVLFMLDELPRLKKMPPVEEALNIGRQYGIKLWMFAQSYGQLKEAYPNPEGLLGSCVVRTFMNVPLNDELATKLSDQLGYRHDALGNTKEKLVEPLELAGPNYRDIILVLATNTKPAKIRKRFAYEDQELKKRMNL